VNDDLDRRAREWAERTALEQGLPAKVGDIAVLRQILRLLGILDEADEPVTCAE
jgi:hypothetical protein